MGAWRRNPDARWRLGPEELERLAALQSDILASAQRLVAPGGRLVYATCSLLPEENEEQISRFMAEHQDFILLPPAAVWQEVLGDGSAFPGLEEELTLTLTPARHGSDGFFMAVMERKKQ